MQPGFAEDEPVVVRRPARARAIRLDLPDLAKTASVAVHHKERTMRGVGEALALERNLRPVPGPRWKPVALPRRQLTDPSVGIPPVDRSAPERDRALRGLCGNVLPGLLPGRRCRRGRDREER